MGEGLVFKGFNAVPRYRHRRISLRNIQRSAGYCCAETGTGALFGVLR